MGIFKSNGNNKDEEFSYKYQKLLEVNDSLKGQIEDLSSKCQKLYEENQSLKEQIKGFDNELKVVKDNEQPQDEKTEEIVVEEVGSIIEDSVSEEEGNVVREEETIPTADIDDEESTEEIHQKTDDIESLHEQMDKVLALVEKNNKLLDGRFLELTEECKRLDINWKGCSDKYNQLVQSCQEDRYRKDKSKLVSACISEANLIRDTLKDYKSRRSEGMQNEEAINLLEDFLSKMIVHIDKRILKLEKVEVMEQAEEGSLFCDEYQDAIGYFETTNETLVNRVYRSESPAYIWTLPYIFKAQSNESTDILNNYRFVLEREKVIIYKLKH